MELTVDHRSDRPVYLQVMDGIKTLIYRSQLGLGAQLPTVRALAATLDINPNTVARAYQELEREGLINSRVGRGTFIAQFEKPKEDKIVAARLKELEREFQDRCVKLGLTEEQFLAHIKTSRRSP